MGDTLQYLLDKGLSGKSVNVVSSLTSGLSFAAVQTSLEETKNMAQADFAGKPYHPDFTGISTNFVITTLFGTLEAFKSNPKPPSSKAKS